MDVLKDLWKDKPLLVAVAAAAALLLYFVYKARPQASVSTTTQPGNIGNTSTMPEGMIQVINPAPVSVQVIPTPTSTTFLPTPVQPMPISQPGNALSGITASYGLLGPGVSVSGTSYRLPSGQTGDINAYLAAQGVPGQVRQGSFGRVWDIFNNMKFLITSGSGPEVNNPYGTDANTYYTG